jgi:hypothetical protein
MLPSNGCVCRAVPQQWLFLLLTLFRLLAFMSQYLRNREILHTDFKENNLDKYFYLEHKFLRKKETKRQKRKKLQKEKKKY